MEHLTYCTIQRHINIYNLTSHFYINISLFFTSATSITDVKDAAVTVLFKKGFIFQVLVVDPVTVWRTLTEAYVLSKAHQ